MTEHTPGPWAHGKLGNNADQWAVYDESGRTIGLSYHGEANARLIAAAPQLLEALWLAIRVIEKGGLVGPENDVYDAAIKASRGET